MECYEGERMGEEDGSAGDDWEEWLRVDFGQSSRLGMWTVVELGMGDGEGKVELKPELKATDVDVDHGNWHISFTRAFFDFWRRLRGRL